MKSTPAPNCIDMKNILNSFLIILSLMAIISCSNNKMQEYVNSSGQVVQEELFRNNRVKSRTVFLNDQRTEYILTNYYESGILEDSAYYHDGVINGMRIFFDQEEGLLYEEHYSGGQLNGIQRAEYANGISSFEGFRKKGLQDSNYQRSWYSYL